MDDEHKELQQKMMEMKMIENALHGIQIREEELVRMVEDLQRSKEAIEELDKYDGAKTMIPLGSGNFVMGKIEDSENVLVGVGAGVAVKKTRKDAKRHLESRILEIEVSLKEIAEQTNHMVTRAIQLREELESHHHE
jgi:prefoldin alpha subunit